MENEVLEERLEEILQPLFLYKLNEELNKGIKEDLEKATAYMNFTDIIEEYINRGGKEWTFEEEGKKYVSYKIPKETLEVLKEKITQIRSGEYTFCNDPELLLLEAENGKNGTIAYKIASPELKRDPDFIKRMVEVNPNLISLLDYEMRNNPDIVITAIENEDKHGEAFYYASERLKKDETIIKKAIESGRDVFEQLKEYIDNRRKIN